MCCYLHSCSPEYKSNKQEQEQYFWYIMSHVTYNKDIIHENVHCNTLQPSLDHYLSSLTVSNKKCCGNNLVYCVYNASICTGPCSIFYSKQKGLGYIICTTIKFFFPTAFTVVGNNIGFEIVSIFSLATVDWYNDTKYFCLHGKMLYLQHIHVKNNENRTCKINKLLWVYEGYGPHPSTLYK